MGAARRAPLALQQAQLAGAGEGLALAVDAQLAVQVLDVPVHRADRQRQPLGDFGAVSLCGQQRQDLRSRRVSGSIWCCGAPLFLPRISPLPQAGPGPPAPAPELTGSVVESPLLWGKTVYRKFANITDSTFVPVPSIAGTTIPRPTQRSELCSIRGKSPSPYCFRS